MPKKTQAIKKSDIKGNKPWLKKVGIDIYPVESLDVKKKFLIVCEGQTEELYFKSFPIANASVKPVHLGCSKTALVMCALEMSIEDYDEIWCVFDFDVKLDVSNQKDDFNTAISMAARASTNDCKIFCAYSNDAFELWFILHYLYLDQQYHRVFFFEKLSELWNINYEAHGKERAFALKIYEKLKNEVQANQENAIKNAEKLYLAVESLPYHEQNPVTTVYQLVRELNKYLK